MLTVFGVVNARIYQSHPLHSEPVRKASHCARDRKQLLSVMHVVDGLRQDLHHDVEDLAVGLVTGRGMPAMVQRELVAEYESENAYALEFCSSDAVLSVKAVLPGIPLPIMVVRMIDLARLAEAIVLSKASCDRGTLISCILFLRYHSCEGE